MIVDVLRPVMFGPRPGGEFGAPFAMLTVPSDTVVFPGEVDGSYMLKEMGVRSFSRELDRGTIVPRGCQLYHAKIVLYGTVYCYTCGWLT